MKKGASAVKATSGIQSLVVYEHGDSAKVLKEKYADKRFDLVITSPPYNVGKEYETKTSIELDRKDQEQIIEEIIRVTSDKGSIC